MTTKLEGILVTIIIALIAGGWWTWHAERLGATKCLASDAQGVTKEVVKNSAAEVKAGTIVNEEAQAHANVINSPVGPVATLGVQHGPKSFSCRSTVPATTAGPVVEADPLQFIRITGPTGDLRRDLDALDRREVQIAREGDDTIRQLWDYADRVCPRPK